MPFGSPRLRGVHEHLERAKYFFDLAQREKDTQVNHRLMLAAVYSSRAIVELMLEAAEKQEIKHLKDPDPKVNRDAFEAELAPKIPFYDLIERIRIHDFHRFGLLPPDSKFKVTMFGGPIKLTASKGGVAISVTGQGPRVSTTGGSQVRFQRPLLTQDGEFFDDTSAKYVKLHEVLRAFLEKAPDVVSQFGKFVT